MLPINTCVIYFRDGREIVSYIIDRAVVHGWTVYDIETEYGDVITNVPRGAFALFCDE